MAHLIGTVVQTATKKIPFVFGTLQQHKNLDQTKKHSLFKITVNPYKKVELLSEKHKDMSDDGIGKHTLFELQI